MSNPRPSYAGKSHLYAQARWDYAPAAVDAICGIAQLDLSNTIADIGAGTGMLGQHFIERVGRVLAFEPDAEMRSMQPIAPNFESLAGLSHATGLPDEHVDLIVVGRAIHWFDPQPTRA